MAGARGPRPGGVEGSTREAIATAARRQFSELGYPRTTVRSIAAEAGVDARLVSHYFGSKQELFVHVVELPFEPEQVFASLVAGGPEGLGLRVATFYVGMMQNEASRRVITGLLRAAASEEQAAAMVRQLLVTRLLGPAARQLGGDNPQLRASLMGSQIAGMTLARHIVGLPLLAEAPAEVLIAALAPVFDHYLLGPLPPVADGPGPKDRPPGGSDG